MSDPVEFDPREWRQLTELLSLEQKGLLMEICCYEWETEMLVYAAAKDAAKVLRVDHRKYRRVLSRLVSDGLVTVSSDGLKTPYSDDE